jgi:hypothetical protein
VVRRGIDGFHAEGRQELLVPGRIAGEDIPKLPAVVGKDLVGAPELRDGVLEHVKHHGRSFLREVATCHDEAGKVINDGK